MNLSATRTEKVQTSVYQDSLSRSLFRATTFLFVLAPLLGESLVRVLTGSWNPSLASSLAMIGVSLTSFLFFRKAQNLQKALQITLPLTLFCYCWGLVAAGGIHAEHIVYLPFFPICFGYILSKRALLGLLGFLFCFGIFLILADSHGLLPPAPRLFSLEILMSQALSMTLFTGYLVGTFEAVRAQSDRQLLATHEALVNKSNLIESKSNELFVSQLKLEEAQSLAQIGSWELDLASRKMEWSSEQYTIFGYPQPQSATVLLGLYLQRSHPEDAAQFENFIRRAETFGEGFSFDQSLVFKDLAPKYVSVTAKVATDSLGRPVSLMGTCQDITERVLQEEENRFILDNLQIGVWKYNPSNQSLVWDKNMYSLYGIEKSDFTNDYAAWEKTLTSEDRVRVVDELKRALRGEIEFRPTFQILRSDGTKRMITSRAKVQRDLNGNPVMMWGINTDSTSEHLVQKKLQQSLEENQTILRCAKFGFITTDLDGLVTGYNEEAQRILGYSPAEVIGKFKATQFHDAAELSRVAKKLAVELGTDVQPGLDTLFCKARAGSFDERQWTFIGKDGRRSQVRLNVTALLDSQGQAFGYMGIAKDLTEVLKIAEALNLERAKNLQNSKMASLGEMSAGVAHEINNPLLIISGSLDLLHRYQGQPEKFAARVAGIREATERISKIVQSLRKFSQSGEKGTRSLHDLHLLLNEALLLTDAKLKKNAIQLELKTEGRAPIYCNEIEIEQVLVNLINNAADAVKDLPEKWLRITVNQTADSVVLLIQDSGSGIPLEIRDKVFEPFFTTKKIGEGTGLGLSIAKGILIEHQATIAIRPEEANTCFELCFPNAHSHQKQSA